MSHIHRHRHVVPVLAVFACTLLGLGASAPAAFAMRVEDSGGSPGVAPTGQIPTFHHTVVTAGMPGWQIALIIAVATLLAAALLAATIAVIVRRVRAVHRDRVVPAT
jgi:hypothetical protein